MSFILSYLAKMILVSACLFGYYVVFQRNASFHQYNRGYLLGIALFALLLPLLQVPIGAFVQDRPSLSAIVEIHKITAGNWEERSGRPGALGFGWSFPGWKILTCGFYLAISIILLTVFTGRIICILRLIGLNPSARIEGVLISLTSEPGTPFSFLKRIFWNKRLDINSDPGKQIFRHELYHVRQNHSLDTLFLELLRRIFWFNPFFHLIFHEVKANHEFLADRYASSGGDKYEYAELLVWQTLDLHSPTLVNSFFNTHLKRRITMLTQFKKTRFGSFNRIMVLPLAFLLFCAFATTLKKPTPSHPARDVKMITVVIDAGHGGPDPGAISKNGVNEKDITLEIAREIKKLSPSYQIDVLMTREEDKLPGGKTTKEDGLHYRTEMANEHKADLFISIHVNSGSPTAGSQVYISSKNPQYDQSVRLGSVMLEEMKKILVTNDQLIQRDKGVWVLQASSMPAVLLEFGNMDDSKELSFVMDKQNQEKIATSVLQGIRHYEDQTANP